MLNLLQPKLAKNSTVYGPDECNGVVMPNGKPLGDCTFGEIKKFHARMERIAAHARRSNIAPDTFIFDSDLSLEDKIFGFRMCYAGAELERRVALIADPAKSEARSARKAPTKKRQPSIRALSSDAPVKKRARR